MCQSSCSPSRLYYHHQKKFGRKALYSFLTLANLQLKNWIKTFIYFGIASFISRAKWYQFLPLFLCSHSQLPIFYSRSLEISFALPTDSPLQKLRGLTVAPHCQRTEACTLRLVKKFPLAQENWREPFHRIDWSKSLLIAESFQIGPLRSLPEESMSVWTKDF